MFYSIRDSLAPPYYPRLVIEQIHHLGIKSMSVVIVAAFASGLVMSLQFGLGLERFGAKMYVPHIVGLSVVKEMGPVFTSLIFAGRVGAGIASEIGSMVITQQIDAIRALGTSPMKKVVIPRIIACVTALPILMLIANIIGIIGAIFIGATELRIDPQLFMKKMSVSVSIYEFYSGVLKTFFFSVIIAFTACYYGLNVERGSKGVGIATTKTVVTCIVLIIISDFFLTKLFWEIQLWLSLK